MLLSHRCSLSDAKCSYYYYAMGILYYFCKNVEYYCTLAVMMGTLHLLTVIHYFFNAFLTSTILSFEEIGSMTYFLLFVFDNKTEKVEITRKSRNINFVSFDYVIIMFNVSCHQTTEAHETYCILLYTPERMEACTLLQTITSEKFLLFIFSVLFVKTFRCFVSLCIHTQYLQCVLDSVYRSK